MLINIEPTTHYDRAHQAVPSILLEGQLRDFAASLGDYEEDSRKNLLRATGFICWTLMQKEELADELECPVPDIVLEGARIAADYVGGSLPACDTPLLDAARAVSWRKHDWNLDRISQVAIAKIPAGGIKQYMQLLRDTTGKGTVFIPVAKGAIASGLLVNGLIRDAVDDSSVLYPVHYSRQKESHSRPKIDETEYDYLSTLNETHNFVVFDEDTFTTRTLEDIMASLRKRAGVASANLIGMTVLRGGENGAPAIFGMTPDGLLSHGIGHEVARLERELGSSPLVA